VIGAILAIACTPLVSTVPGYGLDPSWQLGLSMAAGRGLPAGTGVVFTYGPLGFLAYPNVVWLPGLVLGLVFTLAVAFGLYTLTYRAMLEWLHPIAAVALTAVIAFAASELALTPELLAMACALWALEQTDGRRLLQKLPWWVPCAFGALAGVQLLVKFSVGALGIGLAAVVALSRPARLANVGYAIGGFVATFALWWTLLGEPISSIGPWLRGSLQLAFGYSSAMSLSGSASTLRITLIAVVAFALLVAGCVVLVRRDHARAVPSILVLVGTTWFFVKEGFVRLDDSHAVITFLGVAVLVVAIPWPRRLVLVGAVGGLTILSGFILVHFHGPGGPVTSARELTHAIRSVVQPSYRELRISEARHELHQQYDLPPNVLAALDGRPVHADPWDIAAIWAYGLDWDPLPVFQSYAAFTPSLDRVNRDRLLDARPAILERRSTSIDWRVAAWESPEAMVALTCNYREVASTASWQALSPTAPRCGRPRPLGTRTVREGEFVTTPSPRDPSSIVVATFELPTDPLDRLSGLLFKPRRTVWVTGNENGGRAHLVTGTSEQRHLLIVPAKIHGDVPPNAATSFPRLAFEGTNGSVTVRYFELPTK
jgi:hypothetical protein